MAVYICLSWVMQFFVRTSGISFRWGSKKQIYSPLFVQAERGPWIFIREAFVIQMFGKSLWPGETRAEQNWNIFNKSRFLLETPSLVFTIPLIKERQSSSLMYKICKEVFYHLPELFYIFLWYTTFFFSWYGSSKLSLLREKLQVSKKSKTQN